MTDELELPQTKRVRRSDLDSRSPSSASSPRSSSNPTPIPLQGLSHLDSLPIPTYLAPVAVSPPPANSESTYEFRLFRPTSKLADANTATSTQKISVRSPTPASELGDGAFLGPQRPLSRYLTSYADEAVREENRKRYRAVAREGKDVLAKGLGNCVWKGCELPWKVIHIKVQRASRSKSVPEGAGGRDVVTSETARSTIKKKKSRSGKKRRIAIRKKIQSHGAKELAEKEKRSRKNSRKKARKREKVKEKKGVVAIDENDP